MVVQFLKKWTFTQNQKNDEKSTQPWFTYFQIPGKY